MFTGLVSDVGELLQAEGAGERRLTIATRYDVDTVNIGASINCAGACLTVVAKGHEKSRAWFAVEASAETLRRTSVGKWTQGRKINLERSLRLGDELGGHIVTGHVDGLGTVREAAEEGGSLKLTIELPVALAPFVAAKGSIALDGVSMTVNTVAKTLFTVNIIPHTRAQTTLGLLKAGEALNVEVDVLARYIARLSGQDPAVS